MKYFSEIKLDINEKDIPQLKQLLEDIGGFKFIDSRLSNTRQLNKKTMKSRGSDLALYAEKLGEDFRIEFVPFTRQQDGSIVYRDYCTDQNQPIVLDTVVPPQKAAVDMPEKPMTIMGTAIKCRGLASIYNNLDDALSNREFRNTFARYINPEMLKAFTAIPNQIVIRDARPIVQAPQQQVQDQSVQARG